MAYQKGSRLPRERASKIGHLEVISNDLVRKICECFQDPNILPEIQKCNWQNITYDGKELSTIFSADGSIQPINDPKPPYKAIAFVKTALFNINQNVISKVDKRMPNPFVLRDIMKDSALFHSTAFPLRHVKIPDKNIYHTIREIIYQSVKDEGLNNSLNGAMMETLKWIVFEKWEEQPRKFLEEFDCPHCRQQVATLPFEEEIGTCPGCKKEIFITDIFGLHLNMYEDFASNQVALDYMTVSENLMIFTPIRYFWENNKEMFKQCLFIKDGPLMLRRPIGKLSTPLRRFFRHAKAKGYQVCMIGQEKSGFFYDHLQLIGRNAPDNSLFIPNNDYIRSEIQHMHSIGTYGKDTNYGAKVFVKIDNYSKFVINVPTGIKGESVENPSIDKLIGIKDILTTLPKILSSRFEGGLLPIELVHGIASLSTYPSAKALELFARAKGIDPME